MKTLLSFILLVFSASYSSAKSTGPFEKCSEFMDKKGIHHQLGQIWFAYGDDPKEAKQLENYTVDYKDKPFAHNFTFANLPKKKIWLECVYFACGDADCSSENSDSHPVTIYQEIKQIPVSCKSKVKSNNATRIDSFSCVYSDKK